MIDSRSIRYQSITDLEQLRAGVDDYAGERCLLQVFCGVLDTQVASALLLELQQVFPGAAILGASTCGEIQNAEILNGDILISLSLFEHTVVKSAIVDDFSDLSDAGHELVSQLDTEGGRALILFCCGMLAGRTVNAEPMLDTISKLLPDVVVAGGQAGNNGEGQKTFVFTENGISEHGVAAALLTGTQLDVRNTYNLSWVPIGRRHTITKASGSRVYEIDHQSPKAIYSHYLGEEVADSLPLAAVDFPFIIERDGIPMAVHAISVNKDGSFDYIHNFHAGEQVRFGFCHAGLLALGADVIHEALSSYRPEALFVYSCVSRKWILGVDINLELEAVSDYAPSAGFFCLGEYYTPPSAKPYLFSQTMTVLSLSERGAGDLDQVPDSQTARPAGTETKQFRTLRALHRLLETSASEIETMNAEMAKLARKDSLTSLVNRRAFDEILLKELNHHARSNDQFSMIMLQLDEFKAFSTHNDAMAVDDSLRGVAQVLKRCIKRPGDVSSRYSNEQFACLLAETGEQEAAELAEKIRKRIETLNIPNAASADSGCLTASIGVLTVKGNAALSMQFVLKSADRLLGRARVSGGNQLACDIVGEI